MLDLILKLDETQQFDCITFESNVQTESFYNPNKNFLKVCFKLQRPISTSTVN